MDGDLATEQALKYAEELQELYAQERAQRRRAEEALARLQRSYATTVRALAAALDLRDYGTGGHTERVTRTALTLAGHAAPELTRNPELEYGFLLHDLGKIGIPDGILLKPGPLTSAEMGRMREHTILGEQIVASVPYLSDLARGIVRSHHERWSGDGYPDGLAAEQIPLAARIFAIADTFDAMTSDRPYRAALPLDVALGEITRESGRQFDPELVDVFLAVVPGVERAA